MPEWADRDVSGTLPALRRRGEGDALEFMVSYPANVRDLGKEIAAFATSGGGLIILGVEDDGAPRGLDDCDTPQQRDTFLQRIEGILRGPVSPPVFPKVGFAVEDGRTCAWIRVPRCPEPVYYCHHVPYVRNLTESRPATPDEVVDLVRRWLSQRGLEQAAAAEGADGPDLAHLHSLLIDMFISTDQFPHRRVNPWLRELGFRCESWAKELRQAAREDLKGDPVLAAKITQLAKHCDTIVAEWARLHFGTPVDTLVADTKKLVVELKADLLDHGRMSLGASEYAKEQIVRARDALRDLLEQARERDGIRITDTQRDAAELGRDLLRIALYPLDFLDEASLDDLRRAATELSLLDTIRLYLDGGASLRRVLVGIENGVGVLDAVVQRLRA